MAAVTSWLRFTGITARKTGADLWCWAILMFLAGFVQLNRKYRLGRNEIC